MIDKLMSRRCLIEAAAGALLLSGCSSQDESSTKKVKKQDKIKKAEASGETKHLRDKDELYEVYDDSGIVTMYLTVSRGNSSENTDHGWAEINTYSVYDCADMGVTRYQVMGLLQAGSERVYLKIDLADGWLWRGSAQCYRAGAWPDVELLHAEELQGGAQKRKRYLAPAACDCAQQAHGRGYAFSQQDGL